MANEDGYDVRKIAFCSALCAGFAYVGYSVVSKLLCKNTPICDNEEKESSNDKYESKSIQTEAPLLMGDIFSMNKSVKERVRDLNVIAQKIRKTSIPVPVSPESKPLRNSPNSPWTSPLGCAKYLSFSAENISLTSPLSSPEHKKKSKFPGGKSIECLAGIQENSTMNVNLYKLPLPQDTEITMKTLDSLHKVSRKMTLFETRNIISLLHSNNEEILVKTLSTVSNCAAFTSNQEQLCHAGCPDIMLDLLQHPTESVRVAAVQALSNIAVIDKGYQFFHAHIPVLFNHSVQGGELMKSLSLTALANLALNNGAHRLMLEHVNSVLHLVETGNAVIQLQALRLLVNLSCNKDMIPFLLLCKVSPQILHLIQPDTNREVTLRFLTFLANIITYAVQDLNISSKTSTLMSFLCRMKERSEFSTIVKLSGDSDDNISFQARRLCCALVYKPV